MYCNKPGGHAGTLSHMHSPYSTAAYQKYCALFDKSTKIGTHVDYYLIIIFGYGGTPNCTRSSHSNS